MPDISVEIAPPEEKYAVIDILLLALSADPVFRWKYSDPKDYLKYEPQFIAAYGGRAFEAGTAYVANNNAGAALWLGPGERFDDKAAEDLAAATLSDEKLEAQSKLFEELGKYHPESPHWHLAIIGVDPIHQGKGIGLALMSPILNLCDQRKELAYLEATSERGARLYERIGFNKLEIIQIGSMPPLFPMLREPIK